MMTHELLKNRFESVKVFSHRRDASVRLTEKLEPSQFQLFIHTARVKTLSYRRDASMQLTEKIEPYIF